MYVWIYVCIYLSAYVYIHILAVLADRLDYAATMEATQFRYMRKVMAARRVREVARERQCSWCKRYSFDAARCGGCKLEFYCNSDCQRLAWTKGGHRLVCAAAGMKKRVFPVGVIK